MNVGPHVSVVLPVMGPAGRPGDPGHIVASACAAERLGFDAVWTGDHIRHPRPMLESLVQPELLGREVLPELRSWRRSG